MQVLERGEKEKEGKRKPRVAMAAASKVQAACSNRNGSDFVGKVIVEVYISNNRK